MKINYIETADGKLFSFKRHDFKQSSDGQFIDGGFDYTRTNGKVISGEIKDLIEDIREQFVWGKNYDKHKNLLPKTEYIRLKDLTTDHIIAILIYFTERLNTDVNVPNSWKAHNLIFLYELNYRQENDFE